jgi:hypothetical protein
MSGAEMTRGLSGQRGQFPGKYRRGYDFGKLFRFSGAETIDHLQGFCLTRQGCSSPHRSDFDNRHSY